MALEGYKSNNDVVYSSKYRVVRTPKYRCSVLVGPVAITDKILGGNHRFGNHTTGDHRAALEILRRGLP